MKKMVRIIYTGNTNNMFGLTSCFWVFEGMFNDFIATLSQNPNWRSMICAEIIDLDGDELAELMYYKYHRADGQFVYEGQFVLLNELRERVKKEYKKVVVKIYSEDDGCLPKIADNPILVEPKGEKE